MQGYFTVNNVRWSYTVEDGSDMETRVIFKNQDGETFVREEAASAKMIVRWFADELKADASK